MSDTPIWDYLMDKAKTSKSPLNSRYRIGFSINGRMFGIGEGGPYYIKGTPAVPFSELYICPICGEVWAKIVCLDERTKYSPNMKNCPAHGKGSILSVWNEYYDPIFPLEMVLREIDLVLADPEGMKGFLE